MPNLQIALYARVSTDQQARGNTVDSQVAALRDRIGADGVALEAEDVFVDEGFSGTTLRRPALERLRDRVAFFDANDLALRMLGDSIYSNMLVLGAAWQQGLIPLTLERFRIDPAVAAGPFLTTTTDVLGFFVFLGLASTFLL